jgi:hypothetical protein
MFKKINLLPRIKSDEIYQKQISKCLDKLKIFSGFTNPKKHINNQTFICDNS